MTVEVTKINIEHVKEISDLKRLHDIMVKRYNFVVDLLTEEQHRELHEWYVRTGVIEE